MDNEENFLSKWAAEDEQLRSIIENINASGLPIDEQAELAFTTIADFYGLPKMQTDIECPDDDDETIYDLGSEDEDYDENSIFVELGLLKILYPDDDIRSLVLTALYFVKNRINTNVDEVFEKIYESNNREDILGIGFKGINSKVETILVPSEGEGWYAMGCIVLLKHC